MKLKNLLLSLALAFGLAGLAPTANAQNIIVTYTVVGGDSSWISATIGFGNFITSGTQVSKGATVDFFANPATGYAVRGWTVNNALQVGNTNQFFVVQNLQEDVVVTVEFFRMVELSPNFQTFSLSSPNDLSTAIVWGIENTITRVSCEYRDSTTGDLVPVNLVEGIDFHVIDTTFTITAAFIQSLKPLPHSRLLFEVLFGLGQIHWVEVYVTASPQFLVNYSVLGDGGWLDVRVGWSHIPTNSGVAIGSNLVFWARPNWRHVVKEWVVNGVPQAGNTSNNLTISNLHSNVDVTVEFMEFFPATVNPSVKLFVLSNPQSINASISWGDETFVKGVTYRYWDLSASQWAFVNLQEGKDFQIVDSTLTISRAFIETLDPKPYSWYEFIVNFGSGADVWIHVVVVDYVIYTVNFVTLGGNGTVGATANGIPIAKGDGVVNGDTIVFTAQPNKGFRVKEWLLNGTVIPGHTALTYTVDSLAADVNVEVVFELEVSATIHSLTELRAYPNPFGNQINLSDSEWVHRVVISNVVGQQVMSVILNGASSISTSGLRSGVYLIAFEGKDGQRTVRRMVKH